MTNAFILSFAFGDNTTMVGYNAFMTISTRRMQCIVGSQGGAQFMLYCRCC